MKDATFHEALKRVRGAILLRQGKNAAKDFLLIVDLIELLAIDLEEREKPRIVEVHQ